ncbi:hypothetical protein CPB84DRAFT_1825141 [Gymnopilus junonius]|uniref:Uncharacterized protein n=1 Tax=Gymnopilus junonius TaxID=109634 RepID=A0A9P5TM15_GYMJU|nr:hypothetical protein CPB84DRAFT_1825141 [Gymnopilus junonius]
MIPKTSAEILAAAKPPPAKKSRKKRAPLFSTQTSTFSVTEPTSTATEQSTSAASLLQPPILAGSSQPHEELQFEPPVTSESFEVFQKAMVDGNEGLDGSEGLETMFGLFTLRGPHDGARSRARDSFEDQHIVEQERVQLVSEPGSMAMCFHEPDALRRAPGADNTRKDATRRVLLRSEFRVGQIPPKPYSNASAKPRGKCALRGFKLRYTACCFIDRSASGLKEVILYFRIQAASDGPAIMRERHTPSEQAKLATIY